MASDKPHVILLSGNEAVIREALSATGSAIDPGMLVEVTSDGELQEHSTAGGNAQRLFALNADYVGMGIDETFAEGETVPYAAPRSGDRVYAWLATGNDITEGDLLESDGAGALQAYTAEISDGTSGEIHPEKIVAKAVESLNNTSGSNSRLRVEVL